VSREKIGAALETVEGPAITGCNIEAPMRAADERSPTFAPAISSGLALM